MSDPVLLLASALPKSAAIALWIGLGAGLIACGLLIAARRLDARNWLYERSPELPIRLLEVRDDCWVRGEVSCGSPLVTPHFGVPCVAYRYTLEEQQTTNESDGRGGSRTVTRWVQVESLRDATDFDVVQGDDRVRVHAAEAELKDLVSLGTDEVGSLRHSASILPAEGRVSVLGCVSEHRDWLEKYQNIPLMITMLSRRRFLERVEGIENAIRWCGFVLLCASFSFATYGALGWLGFPHAMGDRFSPVHASLAAFLGVLAFCGSWTLYTFNTLVTYRLRTETAWKQIDVDLKERFDVVPRLVEVVKGIAAHERTLFESLARIRAGGAVAERIAAEKGAAGAVARLVAVAEQFPTLKTDRAFAALQRQLTALEEKIAHARAFFDETATEFNDAIATFPKSIVARLCGFEEWPLFRVAAESERRASDVKFNVIGGRPDRA